MSLNPAVCVKEVQAHAMTVAFGVCYEMLYLPMGTTEKTQRALCGVATLQVIARVDPYASWLEVFRLFIGHNRSSEGR